MKRGRLRAVPIPFLCLFLSHFLSPFFIFFEKTLYLLAAVFPI